MKELKIIGTEKDGNLHFSFIANTEIKGTGEMLAFVMSAGYVLINTYNEEKKKLQS